MVATSMMMSFSDTPFMIREVSACNMSSMPRGVTLEIAFTSTASSTLCTCMGFGLNSVPSRIHCMNPNKPSPPPYTSMYQASEPCRMVENPPRVSLYRLSTPTGSGLTKLASVGGGGGMEVVSNAFILPSTSGSAFRTVCMLRYNFAAIT